MDKYSSFLQFDLSKFDTYFLFCLRPRPRRDKFNILQRTVLFYNPRRITESAEWLLFTSKSNTVFDSINVSSQKLSRQKNEAIGKERRERSE